MRSISESVNSMIKRKMPVKIRKKLPQRKQTEETLKINMHNLRQYNYLKRTNPEMIKDYRGLYSNLSFAKITGSEFMLKQTYQ